MVFLDDDVVIMKEYFLDRLAFRTRAHDFLATYGHADGMRNASYWQSFNSGLVFVRRIEGLDYGMLEKRLYETKGERDQNVVSWFVHEYYDNWDTLSWKWHCRLLQKLGQDIPVDRCYTLHGHGEVDEVLGQLNRTRLRIRRRGAGGEEAGDGEG